MVSEPTIHAWRKHFGQMDAADVKRLKTLEQENARMKKLLAEAALDIEVLMEINANNVWSAPRLQGSRLRRNQLAQIYSAFRKWTAVAVRP